MVTYLRSNHRVIAMYWLELSLLTRGASISLSRWGEPVNSVECEIWPRKLETSLYRMVHNISRCTALKRAWITSVTDRFCCVRVLAGHHCLGQATYTCVPLSSSSII